MIKKYTAIVLCSVLAIVFIGETNTSLATTIPNSNADYPVQQTQSTQPHRDYNWGDLKVLCDSCGLPSFVMLMNWCMSCGATENARTTANPPIVDCKACGSYNSFFVGFFCGNCRARENVAPTTAEPITMPPDPENCNCGDCNGEYKPGYVLGNDKIEIGDAMQILMYLAKMDVSVINNCENAYKAACITGDVPTISDALQILMYLAGIPNEIGLYEPDCE